MIQNYGTNLLPGFCTQSIGLCDRNQKGQKCKSQECTGGFGKMSLQPVHLLKTEGKSTKSGTNKTIKQICEFCSHSML